jgi:hypothetical protein
MKLNKIYLLFFFISIYIIIILYFFYFNKIYNYSKYQLKYYINKKSIFYQINYNNNNNYHIIIIRKFVNNTNLKIIYKL